MAIKKAFQPIVFILTSALEANPKARISEIIDQVTELASAKVGSGGGKATTFHKNVDGKVTHVMCYYHKRWFNVDEVPFGLKASSASGLSSMCKDGTSKWTKQQTQAKKAEAELLDKVISGELQASDLEAARQEIAEAAKAIVPLTDDNGVVLGYETLEEALQA